MNRISFRADSLRNLIQSSQRHICCSELFICPFPCARAAPLGAWADNKMRLIHFFLFLGVILLVEATQEAPEIDETLTEARLVSPFDVIPEADLDSFTGAHRTAAIQARNEQESTLRSDKKSAGVDRIRDDLLVSVKTDTTNTTNTTDVGSTDDLMDQLQIKTNSMQQNLHNDNSTGNPNNTLADCNSCHNFFAKWDKGQHPNMVSLVQCTSMGTDRCLCFSNAPESCLIHQCAPCGRASGTSQR